MHFPPDLPADDADLAALAHALEEQILCLRGYKRAAFTILHQSQVKVHANHTDRSHVHASTNSG